MKPDRVLLIGAGAIATDYAATLKQLETCRFDVLSRREESALLFAKAHGAERAHWGGLDALPRLIDGYDAFIVACPIEYLMPYALALASAGKSRVLLEKPLALRSSDVASLAARFQNFKPWVALNRLFFPSVLELKRRLREQRAVAARFSFTEWVHRIDADKYHPDVLARWGASNCIHVIATCFDLIGNPITLSSYSAGHSALSWHPAGTIFTGAGMTDRNVPFVYHADWVSAGRWSIAIDTPEGRYDLEPMESLRFTPKGSIADTVLVAAPQDGLRAGFPQMLRAWLADEQHDNVSLDALRAHLTSIESMMYPNER